MHKDEDNQHHDDQKRLIDAAWQQIQHARTTQDFVPVATGESPSKQPSPWRTSVSADFFPGYRVDGEIHRGGQGVVYRCTQSSTGRTVAIKVMHGGPFAGPREKARFDREVQILAQLKHPNIVTVHDSGIVDSAAYFVMDYIPGQPLDAWAQKSEPRIHDRLRVFARICDAVNVAHLRGVIHRDLKPGNIRIDEKNEPHVLDFGLAKHAALDPAARTNVTVTGQFVGSLPWASPEQAQGKLDELDLRTDVYSLGVMLYQLLTGDFPYDVSGSLTEAAHNIVHQEPKNPRALNTRLDDEIATIALKALRKERELRYQTAGELGRDIERYLKGEPIEAKRDSMTYVVRKQLARHKAAVAVVAAFFALIVVGFVVSVSFWRLAVVARDAETQQKRAARQNEQVALAQANRAAEESAKARAVSDFLTDMLASASPVAGEGFDLTVRDAIAAAERRIEQGGLSNQPTVEAAVRRAIGMTYGGLGMYDEASRQLESATALFATLTEADEDRLTCAIEHAAVLRKDGDLDRAEALFNETIAEALNRLGDDHNIVALARFGLGSVMRDRDRFDEAVRLYRQAWGVIAEAEGLRNEAASLLNDLALVLSRQGKLDEAIEHQRQSLDRFIGIYGDQHHATAVARSNLAELYGKKGEFDRAEAMHDEALTVFRKVGGEKHPSVASALDNLGRLHLRQQEFKKAEPLMREALAIRRATLGDDHALVAHGLNNLAIVYYQLGRLDDAIGHFLDALELFKSARGEDHPSLASIMNNIAAVMRVKGDAERALPLLQESLAIRKANLGEDHPSVAESYQNIGQTLLDLGRIDEAEDVERKALRIREERLGADHPDTANTMDALAGVLRKKGELDEAESLCRNAYETLHAKFGDDHLSVADALNNLGGIIGDRGDYERAEPLFADALDIMRSKLPAGHWRIAAVQANWGGALVKLGRFDVAERALLEAHPILAKEQGAAHERTQRVVRALIELYDASDRPEEAGIWRQKLDSAE